MEQLNLGRHHWRIMRTHVESCSPLEACGLLAGHGDRVHEVLLIANELRSRTRFRMDPRQQIQAFNHMDDAGMELLGIFHSHPGRPAAGVPGRREPSATDVSEAVYNAVQLIWSCARGRWRVRAFRLEAGQISEVALRISDGKQP